MVIILNIFEIIILKTVLAVFALESLRHRYSLSTANVCCVNKYFINLGPRISISMKFRHASNNCLKNYIRNVIPT